MSRASQLNSLPQNSASAPAVAARNLTRTFDQNIKAVDNLTLQIRAGEFVALLGPSGCGKSTLLRMIAGLETPTAGELRIDDNARRAFVFQDAHLLPWRNVLHNVALPLELRGQDRSQRRAAQQAIAAVGLSEAVDRYPAQLSGGMRMRVSLARALVTEPNLLLLDEPFAALDEITRAALDVQLRELWIERRMTVLFVTHSITEAAFLADRAIVFSPRPARIVLDTPIDLGERRTDDLRGDAGFAAYTRELLRALHGTGGGA
jgi:NitT/TauT family transport system ATP-binding protein